MVKTVYLDVLFCVNFLLNYLILLATAKAAHIPYRRGRLILSASFGAVYGVCMFFPSLSFFYTAAAKLLSAVCMSWIAFHRNGKLGLPRVSLLFLAISFAFGGGITALQYIFGGKVSARNGVAYFDVSFGVLMLCAGAVYLLFAVFLKRWGQSMPEKAVVRVSLRHERRQTELMTMLDNGSHLTDPLTNDPVIVAEYNAVRDLLPKEARDILDAGEIEDGAAMLEALAGSTYASRFRILPFSSVGVRCGMLLAFRPGLVEGDGKERKHAPVAISPTRISSHAGYNAVVGV